MLRFLCDRNRHRAGWRFLRFTTTVTVKKSAEAEKRLDNSPSMPYNNHCCAGVAHLVERDLAKVEVASSSLVARSKKTPSVRMVFLFGQVGQRLERARAQREKHAGGMFWCPCACGGPAGPPASLVARSKKKDTRRGVFLFGAALLLLKSGRLRAGDLTYKGNPTKVSLAYIPFLAIYRSARGQQNL